MSLHDEHLAKALKHAPDSDLAPSELVRKSVLNYAKQASQHPHGYWLAGLLSNIKNWQWVGMSSVAVALLAALMLREQLPEEPIWRESKVREAAQNSAPAPEKALKEERADMAAAPTTNQEEAPARTAGTREKAKAEASATGMADKTVLAEAPEVVALPAPVQAPAEQTPSKQALAKQDNGVVAENTAKTEATGASAPASDAVASAEQTIATVEKSEAEKPAAAAKKSVTLVDAVALGVAKANQDIHAGVLRILVADWPADKSLVDETTGYRVELAADLVPAELEAYNQTMRDWFKTQH